MELWESRLLHFKKTYFDSQRAALAVTLRENDTNEDGHERTRASFVLIRSLNNLHLSPSEFEAHSYSTK